MKDTESESREEQTESHRYNSEELDLMDSVSLPHLNPWLSLILLILLGFIYVWIWEYLLRD